MIYYLSEQEDGNCILKSDAKIAFLAVYITSAVLLFVALVFVYLIVAIVQNAFPHRLGVVNQVFYLIFMTFMASVLSWRAIVVFFRNAKFIEYSPTLNQLTVSYFYPVKEKIIPVNNELLVEVTPRGKGHVFKAMDNCTRKCVLVIEIEQSYEAVMRFVSLIAKQKRRNS